MKEKLDTIDVKFFDSVGQNAEDIQMIKARGEANKKAAAEQELASASKKVEEA